MIELTALEIAQATGGTLVGDPSVRITCVCTDTRAMKPNSLFIALKGDTFDAHDHLDTAFSSGATLALVSRDAQRSASETHILVPNTRLAMGLLATYVRRRFTKTKVIAVAGSNGKTGTKHLIHSALSTTLKGTMSPKSFNNDVGVPITLFGVAPDDDFVVVEIGTNHPGEVSHLSRMSEPDIAVITSIGEEHMGFFKTLDGVRDENAHIVDGLRPNGLLLINGDDAGLRERLPHATTFGFGDHNHWIARDARSTLDGTSFVAATPASPIRASLDGMGDAGVAATYTIPQIGLHNASNALVAIAIAHELGLSEAETRRGLASATSPEMRMQTLRVGAVTLINDAYNANPTSVRAALNTLDQIDWSGRKIVVLGEMRELGEASRDAHDTIHALATSLAPSRCFFVGNEFPHHDTNWFPDASTAAPRIADQIRDNDLVLIKGSRSMKMEQVQRAIEARFVPPTK